MNQVSMTLGRWRRELVWVLSLGLLINGLMLMPTLYMLQVYDRLLTGGNLLTLLTLTAVALLFLAVVAFADWLRARLLVRLGVRLDGALEARAFGAALRAAGSGAAAGQPRPLPLQPLDDLTQVRQFLTGAGLLALIDAPWMVIFLGALFLLHPMLGAAALLMAVLQLLLAGYGHRLTTRAVQAAQQVAGQARQQLQGLLRGAETLEAMGMRTRLRQRWLAEHRQQLDAQNHAHDRLARVQAQMRFMQLAQQALMLALGAWLALQGQISPGSMIAANMLASLALRPAGQLVQTWQPLVEARWALRRLHGALTQPAPQPLHHPLVHAGQVLRGQVELQDLVASAPGRQTPILRGIVAQFHAGEVVAIVGASGAGKSTLGRCLLGCWPHISGRVLLDGQAIEPGSRHALGAQLGYLPQDIGLLEGTVAENIARFGAVDSRAVIEAAQRTGVHEMILRLPQGYNTRLADGGGQLSGGQRQRIALARAIYGNPALVVLDEPNANLDEAGVAALMRTVRELSVGGSTICMIVHDPQLLAVADRVLMLADGRVDKLISVVDTATAPDRTRNLA